MDKIIRLLKQRDLLLETVNHPQSTPDLETAGGRQYIHWLCKRVVVEMAIEIEKRCAQ